MKQNYLRFVFVLLTCFGGFSLYSQGFGLPPGFDLKTFEKNQDQALWFIEYDSTWQAVVNFDHISGAKDYICYPDKKGWKVVCGTVDSAGFKEGASFYQVDSKRNVTAAKKRFDTLLVASMGRALFNANTAISKLSFKSAGGWHRFMRTNLDQSIVVWAFCDTDATGAIWYGPECTWYYTPDGRKLNTSKIVNKSPLMAGKGTNSLNMSCPIEKMPTVGTIWLAHLHKKEFVEINVTYKTGTSTLRYNADEKTFAWEHTAN
jgi:hypothetical protein